MSAVSCWASFTVTFLGTMGALALGCGALAWTAKAVTGPGREAAAGSAALFGASGVWMASKMLVFFRGVFGAASSAEGGAACLAETARSAICVSASWLSFSGSPSKTGIVAGLGAAASRALASQVMDLRKSG